MCGIVGFTGPRNESTARAMNDRQRHRGPDDEGYSFDPRDEVTLAMRRLSILDIEGGRQPMVSADGSLTIVYNGEIYNAPELRRELLARGHVFKTHHSDTEVLLNLYQDRGADLLHAVNGMFAFVIHDRRRRVLFGARDRLGIKPLYYSLEGGHLRFASELKSLLELPGLGRELDTQAAFHYFSFQCVPGPGSIFKGISKLAPASRFEFDLTTRRFTGHIYWRPHFGGPAPVAERELPRYIRHELEQAVARWTLSDVPVACSLSGGIDSSAIVGIMAGSLGAETGRLHTYSLGFEDAPELDETRLARRVAERHGTSHHEIIIRADDLLDDLDAMIYALDEPYAGGLPSWFVFKAMARDVKVGMTGTGGDELFGNYVKWLPYERPLRKLRRLLDDLSDDVSLRDAVAFPRGHYYHLYFRDAFKRSALFPREAAAGLEASEALIERYWRDAGVSGPRDAVPAIDLRLQLPEEFLHMTDRFSMAFSLEARTPFLDHVFVEKMLAIPAATRTHRGRPKYLLLEAVKDLLPPELLTGRKRGFVLPMARWLRGRLRDKVEHYLGRDYLRRQGLLLPSLHDRFVRPHLDGTADCHWQLWTLLMFQLWHERFCEGRR